MLRALPAALLLLSAAGMLSSCDFLSNVLTPPSPPVLGITETSGILLGDEIFPGTEVVLDASGTSDPNGDPFVLEWQLTVPGTSATRLAEEYLSGTELRFTPDVPGEYILTAFLSDGELDTREEIRLKTGLEAYWNMDGGIGDSSPGARNLTLTGSSASASGRNGSADSAVQISPADSLSFDTTAAGEADTFKIEPGDVTYGNFSMAFWLNLNTLPSADSSFVTMDNAPVGPTPGWRLEYISANDELSLTYDNIAPMAAVGEFTSSQVSAGSWHHVAVTFHQDTGNLKIYIDGTSRALETNAVDLPHVPSPFTIGNNGVQPGFDGIIDEFHVYNRTLTSEEIKELSGN